MDEKTHTQDREHDQSQRQFQDRALVPEKTLFGDAPAVQKQKRRQEQEEKMSGFSSTAECANAAMTAPRAIWTRGKGIGTGDMRARAPLTTTAKSRNRTSVIVSMGKFYGMP